MTERMKAAWSLFEDTINTTVRGDGEFEVPHFIEQVRKTGYEGPYGIEVPVAGLRGKPLAELATRAFQTTLAQFPDLSRPPPIRAGLGCLQKEGNDRSDSVRPPHAVEDDDRTADGTRGGGKSTVSNRGQAGLGY